MLLSRTRHVCARAACAVSVTGSAQIIRAVHDAALRGVPVNVVYLKQMVESIRVAVEVVVVMNEVCGQKTDDNAECVYSETLLLSCSF